MLGAEGGDEGGRVRGRQVCDGGDTQGGKLFRRLGPDTPEGVDRAVAHHGHPVGVGELVHAGRLAETGGHFGALLVVADADRTGQPGLGGDHRTDPLGQVERIVHGGSEVRLVPAPPHLEGMAEITQQAHHLFGGLVVGGRIRRQEGGVGGHFRAAVRKGMPACTPTSRASYEAQVTTLRGSVGSPEPPTITGRPASSGWRRNSTEARNWSRSTCRIQGFTCHRVCGPRTPTPRRGGPGRGHGHGSGVRRSRVQQRQESVRLGIEIACGSRGFEQHPNMRVVQGGGGS